MKKLIEKIAKDYSVEVKFRKDGKLTKKSLEEFRNKVDWVSISIHQILSERFIREFQEKVDWYYISVYQKLSEDFIREFQDKVSWCLISKYQKLSVNFIREFQKLVNWYYISLNQELSEDLIRDFQYKVDWVYISRYQVLSEEFIREFQDKVNWYWISKYQKLSKKFREEFNIQVPKTCWLYKPTNFKLKYLKENTDYEIIDNKYIIAYKSVQKDMRSVYRPDKYKYEIGKTYTSNCDYNVDKEGSFGLSAWTKEGALNYHSDGILLKVKIDIKDIGAIVKDNNKIRCCKQTIMEIIE